jgi:hypothetical protein
MRRSGASFQPIPCHRHITLSPVLWWNAVFIELLFKICHSTALLSRQTLPSCEYDVVWGRVWMVSASSKDIMDTITSHLLTTYLRVRNRHWLFAVFVEIRMREMWYVFWHWFVAIVIQNIILKLN